MSKEKTIRTIRGSWQRYNTFITENGETIKVYPYPMTGNQYYHKIPFKCFMQIHGDIIKIVVEE